MFVTFTWLDLSIVFFAAFGTFVLATLLEKMGPGLTKSSAKADRSVEPSILPANETLSFEFDLEGTLVCSNLSGSEFLSGLKLFDPDWATLRNSLMGRFPDLPEVIEPCDTTLVEVLDALCAADPLELELVQHSQGLSLILRPRIDAVKNEKIAIHQVFSSLPDLSLVHAVSERAPFPVWQTLQDGSVGWSNIYYKSLDARITRECELLFDLTNPSEDALQPSRITLKDEANNRTHWFDVTHQSFGDGMLHFATDVHAVVSAESAQRNFVQTLAKTFAHLATGLAIFDRKRQLVLFNPSLLDITELRPEFLTARPNLFSFFDQLRDNQIMPEPKNYANWRERIADVISAASDDNFNETWHLPNGLTYRVTGRPHPDGAIAFLFEDISAEISLTRRFRSEADVTRSAFDALDQSIAIFNAGGFLQHSNLAMAQLIGEKELGNMSVHDMTRLCQRACKPSPAWGEIRDFVTGASEREVWSVGVEQKNGERLELRVSPLASGASLVTLVPVTDRSTLAIGKMLSRESSQRSANAAA